MAFVSFTREEVKDSLLAGMILAGQMGHGERLAGVFFMAQHQALTYGLDWPELVREARFVLGENQIGMIEGGK